MINLFDDPTPEETDRAIDRIAAAIVKRRMETPAILFLEMHKPLSFIASQGLIVTSPLIAPVIGFYNARIATHIMQDRRNVERLIQRIEDRAGEGRDSYEAHEESKNGKADCPD